MLPLCQCLSMETSVICKYMWICVHVTPLESAVHFGLMYLFCLLWPALCTHRLLSVPAARALLSTSIHHHYTCPDAGPLLNHSLPYLDLQDRPGQGRAGQGSSKLQHCNTAFPLLTSSQSVRTGWYMKRCQPELILLYHLYHVMQVASSTKSDTNTSTMRNVSQHKQLHRL